MEVLSGWAKKGEELRACVSQREVSLKNTAPNAQANSRTAGIEVVAKQALMQHAEPTACIAQLKIDFHVRKSRLQFLECCNSVADSWYSLQDNEWNLLMQQFVSSRVCSGEMLQQHLASA